MVVAGCAFKDRRISEEDQKKIRRKSGDYQKKIRKNHKKIRRRSEGEEKEDIWVKSKVRSAAQDRHKK